MKCLYSSRNNSFNQPIFQSKLLELLSRNYKNKKKITMESLSFCHKCSTSKISQTNSYINSNTNTNTNSLIKQSGNNTKKKGSQSKINSKHQVSMSNDNFVEFHKKIKNMDVINTIYTTTKANSKSKNKKYFISNKNNNSKKQSKNKNNNNNIKNEKSAKNNQNKKIKYKSKIINNYKNDFSLKKENEILRLKILELQNENDKLKNENDLLVSQNRNKKACLTKTGELYQISNEKGKKLNKMNNNLNLEMNKINNNYPCDYFNMNINSENNLKSHSPIQAYINSSRKAYNNILERIIISNKVSRDNININLSNN